MTQDELFIHCHKLPPCDKTVREVLIELKMPLTLENAQTVLLSQAPFSGFIAAQVLSLRSNLLEEV